MYISSKFNRIGKIKSNSTQIINENLVSITLQKYDGGYKYYNFNEPNVYTFITGDNSQIVINDKVCIDIEAFSLTISDYEGYNYDSFVNIEINNLILISELNISISIDYAADNSILKIINSQFQARSIGIGPLSQNSDSYIDNSNFIGDVTDINNQNSIWIYSISNSSFSNMNTLFCACKELFNCSFRKIKNLEIYVFDIIEGITIEDCQNKHIYIGNFLATGFATEQQLINYLKDVGFLQEQITIM